MSSSTLEALTIYIFKICKNVLKQTRNTNVKSNTVLINTEKKNKVWASVWGRKIKIKTHKSAFFKSVRERKREREGVPSTGMYPAVLFFLGRHVPFKKISFVAPNQTISFRTDRSIQGAFDSKRGFFPLYMGQLSSGACCPCSVRLSNVLH